MLNHQSKDYHLSVLQKLWHSDTRNQVKSCIKHGKPDYPQRELTVAFIISVAIACNVFIDHNVHVVFLGTVHYFYAGA